MSGIDHYKQGMAAFVRRAYPACLDHLAIVAADAKAREAHIARYFLAEAHTNLARELFEQAQFHAAALHFTQAARLLPENRGLAHHLMRSLAADERFELAADALEGMLANDPDNIELRIRLALACRKAGQPWRSLEVIREGLRRNPESAELHYQHGVLSASSEAFEQAQASFEAALGRDPHHARAMERLAQCYGVAGRHQRALYYLQQANSLDPGNTRVAAQLALIADHSHGRITLLHPRAAVAEDAAVARLAQAIQAEPDFVDALLALPRSDADAQVFGTLAAALERSLRRHPHYADLHYHCGRVRQRLGDHPLAVAHAERAVALNPRYVNALILLAELYAQTDRSHDAVERLEAAIQAGGDYPDVHYLLGRLFERLGQKGAAKRAYGRAVELNANYQEARDALAKLAA